MESAGIATVVIGSALDILLQAGTPRIVFNDLPLGNPVGKPFDRTMQHRSISAGLDILYSADAPGTLVQMPHRWADDSDWQENFMAVREEDKALLAQLGIENREARRQNKAKGLFRP